MRSLILTLILPGCLLGVKPPPPECEDADATEPCPGETATSTPIDTGTSETTEPTDTGTSTTEECPYALYLSDVAPYEPICSGEFEQTDMPATGDLFVAESIIGTFYYQDGFRYTVPYGSVWESWWGTDECVCGEVKQAPDEVVHEIVLGGELTIKPGSFIVKIAADPQMYVIAPPCTIHAASEEMLAAIYGDKWSGYVRTIEEWFFVAFALGEPLESADDYDLAAAQATTLESVIEECDH